MFQPTVGLESPYGLLFPVLTTIYVCMIVASLRYQRVTNHSTIKGGRDGMVE